MHRSPDASMNIDTTLKNVAGEEMISLMESLWPICRSITGDGVRSTLNIIKNKLPGLDIHEIPTGTKCFDWSIPKEWNIREAYVLNDNNERVIDFADHNLHIVSYSIPVDAEMELEELEQHLYSIPEQPDAIPYVTSYYKENWGFCIQHSKREKLKKGKYKVYIDSSLEVGSLTYAELIIPGRVEEEVFFSTYICHPTMANNELSGPCLAAQLAQHLSRTENYYSYRFVFIPETIGAICYLSRNLEELQRKIKAGFILTCVGDERAWSYMPSISGNTYSDVVSKHVLLSLKIQYDQYSFLQRGSDERQYCSPGIDLPVCSIMRSKYMTYSEYHTSYDDLTLVTAKGMSESFEVYCKIIEAIEFDCVPCYTVKCEPKMSDRGLRPTTGIKGSALSTMDMMNLLVYSNGKRTLLEISVILNKPIWELKNIVDILAVAGLLKIQLRRDSE
jgi:aminopeptidase-like protein